MPHCTVHGKMPSEGFVIGIRLISTTKEKQIKADYPHFLRLFHRFSPNQKVYVVENFLEMFFTVGFQRKLFF